MISLLLSLAFAEPLVLDRVAAVVDNEVITLTEVYALGGEFIEQRCTGANVDSCQNEMELQILDELIKRALIRQELDSLGMRVTGAEVDQAIDTVVTDNGFPSREALRAEVERSGTKWQDYREQVIREQMRLQRFQSVVLAGRVSVTDDEVRDMYQRTTRDVQTQPVVDLEAFGLLFPDDADEAARAALLIEISTVVEEINSGKRSWAKATKEYDRAKLASAVGGQSYKKGQLAPGVDEVVFDPEVALDQALPPIVVGGVIFVVKVTGRDEVKGEARSYEEVAESLRNAIFQQKLGEAEQEWYQRARRQSAVEVLLEL